MPFRELAGVIQSGEAMLFTGAGFSSDARDLDGNALPDSAQMSAELWPLVFAGEAPDSSSLADLYDVAMLRVPERLRAYLDRRLRIGDTTLAAHYAAWFSAPWRRIYTLNVDDLEVAVQRQFTLPRRLRSVSAMARERPAPDASVVDVVHLNGTAGSDATDLTFSTMQYASRLCARDREYSQLVADLEQSPFVFVGTTLDEVILWQHFELHRQRNGDTRNKAPSFLVSASLTRARQFLLESMGIRWIRSTVAEIAEHLL